ncbi:hypothetical protein Pyn_20612 [Prunus yedoensis var. nudiflora]|uniref:Uncharacterized protein n=1 Tax=Prunus yedoensis var. nudiflora TaxID=2094558 RepID=A0A314UVP4_PRUYE|nr:hypothetical protein Pyn_20612 [Prunus yedoensis var. nudiflora]
MLRAKCRRCNRSIIARLLTSIVEVGAIGDCRYYHFIIHLLKKIYGELDWKCWFLEAWCPDCGGGVCRGLCSFYYNQGIGGFGGFGVIESFGGASGVFGEIWGFRALGGLGGLGALRILGGLGPSGVLGLWGFWGIGGFGSFGGFEGFGVWGLFGGLGVLRVAAASSAMVVLRSLPLIISYSLIAAPVLEGAADALAQHQVDALAQPIYIY